MILHDDFIWCKGCGVEITWSPYIIDYRNYCCEECSRGLPCQCAERMEIDNDVYRYSANQPSRLLST